MGLCYSPNSPQNIYNISEAVCKLLAQARVSYKVIMLDNLFSKLLLLDMLPEKELMPVLAEKDDDADSLVSEKTAGERLFFNLKALC